MAEEVGIVMSLYDRVSPTLKAISGSTKAFDKDLDELEQGLKAYDKAQDQLTRNHAALRKAIEASNQKVSDARKEFKKFKDETSRGALDAAIDEQTRLNRELKETESAIRTQRQLYEDLYTKARKAAQGARDMSSAASSATSPAGTIGLSDALSRLGAAGLGNLVGDAVSQAAGVFIESALGQPLATAVSSALSGAASGAAMGSILGVPGMVAGALTGGLAGAITGRSQIYEAQDDSFKSYVQEAVEGQLSEMDTIRSSGSATAGQREQDQIAFAQRFGSDQAAEDYLEQVKAMAVGTNYTYDEITGYSKSLLNSYSADETLDVLQKLSDATAGLNLDSSGVSMFIAGLSRMRTTGKVTQEYLNYFSERGLDVYDALARSTGADKSQITDLVSDGKIGGTEAAQAILDYIQEEFGGLSEKLAGTYDAMVDNLGDAEANLNARMGEGYNEARKAGIEAQQEWLNSDELGEAYEAIGAWKAEMENAKEQYIREAVDEAMSSEDYQTAQAEGDAAEMGRIIMQAKIQGMNEYNANEGKDEVLAQELALIEGVRTDTSLNENYWNAGYTLGQAFSQGRAAGMAGNSETWGSTLGLTGGSNPQRSAPSEEAGEELSYVWVGNPQRGGYKLYSDGTKGYATGLARVPYDNFPALLHEGERVLTAAEARGYNQGGSGGVTIVMNGTTIREDADVDRVAQALLEKLRQADMAGVG